MDIEGKVKAAGISSHAHSDGVLDLFHNGAYRTYPDVNSEAALAAAIAEFKANTPAEWYA